MFPLPGECSVMSLPMYFREASAGLPSRIPFGRGNRPFARLADCSFRYVMIFHFLPEFRDKILRKCARCSKCSSFDVPRRFPKKDAASGSPNHHPNGGLLCVRDYVRFGSSACFLSLPRCLPASLARTPGAARVITSRSRVRARGTATAGRTRTARRSSRRPSCLRAQATNSGSRRGRTVP